MRCAVVFASAFVSTLAAACGPEETAHPSAQTPTPDQMAQGPSPARPNQVAPIPLPRDPGPFRPLKKDECIQTRVIEIAPRLDDVCALGGPGRPAQFAVGGAAYQDVECGMAIYYGFGGKQAFWETNIEIKDTWRIGDPIKICRLDSPDKCQPGFYDSDALYRATNLRTTATVEQNSVFHGPACDSSMTPE